VGKRVIPFNTNAGYGVGSGFQTAKELCADSKFLEGFTTQGGVENWYYNLTENWQMS
jgi:hypothetical protein